MDEEAAQVASLMISDDFTFYFTEESQFHSAVGSLGRDAPESQGGASDTIAA